MTLGAGQVKKWEGSMHCGSRMSVIHQMFILPKSGFLSLPSTLAFIVLAKQCAQTL